jgi:gamma-glutamylcyclotransferase (GGCT)/AIG2-like uncharacterized protein YtfP
MKHLVFVYGTLKKGQRNHHLLKDADYFGKATTTKPYWMYSTGEYPVCMNRSDGGTLISGELYECNDLTLSHLDMLEAHPDLFKRELTVIDMADKGTTVSAWMYFGTPTAWNAARDGLPTVPAGVWIRADSDDR